VLEIVDSAVEALRVTRMAVEMARADVGKREVKLFDSQRHNDPLGPDPLPIDTAPVKPGEEFNHVTDLAAGIGDHRPRQLGNLFCPQPALERQ
jgi:hypothetical protein